jgi:hypothetical protein
MGVDYNIPFIVSRYDKVIVELGMGDGILLRQLRNIEFNKNSIFIGIEIDKKKYFQACDVLGWDHVCLIRDDFEKIIHKFPLFSIDEAISVLPHPNYIDRALENCWIPFYQTLLSKLKINGILTIVTELTNDLLDPISDTEFQNWKEWLVSIFLSIGFDIKRVFRGIPDGYITTLLDAFKADPLRIKILTIELGRKYLPL